MLKITKLKKQYGQRILFSDADFILSDGERVGLIGRNGCGKSTLFRLILEQEQSDDGHIQKPKGYRIGHLAQHLHFTENTILDEVCLALPDDEIGMTYKGEIILGGLGFSNEDMQKSPDKFSGGFQIRLNLAKLILSNPHLLLLDEPTNYLDILSMRYLAKFLRAWEGEVMLISHDRAFLDEVCTHTLLINRKQFRKIKGGTDKLYEQISQEDEIHEKTKKNLDKRRAQVSKFIERFGAKASKVSQVHSREKMLDRMGQMSSILQEGNLEFSFQSSPFPGSFMLRASDISFSYPQSEQKIIENFSLEIKPKSRIGIIGKNGKGKSTLLRLLVKEILPDSGEIKIQENTKLGYFGQTNIDNLNPELTVEEEVAQANPKLTHTHVRQIAGTMMFSGDDAFKKISVLSGGEKSRVMLGKIIGTPTNMLLLDEPTNHLDMQSIDALITSVMEYDGSVMIVTHSEEMLRSLVDQLIILQNDKVTFFDGTYDEFLEKIGWQEESGFTHKKSEKNNSKNIKIDTSKRGTTKSITSNISGKQRQLIQKKLSTLENNLEKLNIEKERIESELMYLSSEGDFTQIQSLSLQLDQIQSDIQSGEIQWMELTESLEK